MLMQPMSRSLTHLLPTLPYQSKAKSSLAYMLSLTNLSLVQIDPRLEGVGLLLELRYCVRLAT